MGGTVDMSHDFDVDRHPLIGVVGRGTPTSMARSCSLASDLRPHVGRRTPSVRKVNTRNSIQYL